MRCSGWLSPSAGTAALPLRSGTCTQGVVPRPRWAWWPGQEGPVWTRWQGCRRRCSSAGARRRKAEGQHAVQEGAAPGIPRPSAAAAPGAPRCAGPRRTQSAATPAGWPPPAGGRGGAATGGQRQSASRPAWHGRVLGPKAQHSLLAVHEGSKRVQSAASPRHPRLLTLFRHAPGAAYCSRKRATAGRSSASADCSRPSTSSTTRSCGAQGGGHSGQAGG